jgi:hypothetical protein
MYAKVFSSIFDGSMRGHSDLILVFVNILCHANQDGIVDRTCQAIADETGLPVRRVEAAVASLEGPDKQSRSRNDDGRRIKRIDPERAWGWEIVNFKKYDGIRNSEERREYMRNLMREKRKEKLLASVSNALADVSNVSLLSSSASSSASLKNKNLSDKSDGTNVYPDDFVQFWNSYPRKEGKKKAFKAWQSAKDKPEISQILRQLVIQKQSEQWQKDNGQFIPHPATWLNGGRWMDEPVKVSDKNKSAPSAPLKKSFNDIRLEIITKLEESSLAGGDSISRCLSACNDLYRDVPKRNGARVVDEAYEIFKHRNKK